MVQGQKFIRTTTTIPASKIMSTISFQDSITTTTLAPPTLRRRERIHRPHLQSADKSSDKHLRIEATTDTHSQRRNRNADTNGHRRRHRNRSSIHLSIPPIQDRDSSLYSQPAQPLPYYDWSKSCSDLTTRNIFPHSATSTNTPSRFRSQTNLNQSILGSPYFQSSAAVEIKDTIKWCQSTLDLSSITDDSKFTLDDHYNPDQINTHKRHEITRCPSPEPQHPLDHKYCTSTYLAPCATPDKQTKWSTRFGQLKLGKKLRTYKVSVPSSPWNKVYLFHQSIIPSTTGPINWLMINLQIPITTLYSLQPR